MLLMIIMKSLVRSLSNRIIKYYVRIAGKIIFITGLLTMGILTACSSGESTFTPVQSPDGNIEIRMQLDQERALVYTMTYKGQTVIEKGEIGIELAESGFLGKSLELVNTEFSEQVEEYTLYAGKSSNVIDKYTQKIFEFRETNQKGRKLIVIFRRVSECDSGRIFRWSKTPMVLGTRGHHLAMFVVYESPLQMVADWPGAYRGEKGGDFLKVVPASWDETVPLEGEIGEYIIMARRKGDQWC